MKMYLRCGGRHGKRRETSDSDPYMSNSSSKITWFVVMSNVLHNCLVCFKHNLLNMIDNNAKHDSKANNLTKICLPKLRYSFFLQG
jgi:hypothetical protein